jgi:hypothetical protein
MDAAYGDKLDGKISEGFWQRRQSDGEAEEHRTTARLAALKEPSKDNTLGDVRRILEPCKTHIPCMLSRILLNRLNCCGFYFGTARLTA